jgi:cytochrome bd-type quinol oxidase subunit 1
MPIISPLLLFSPWVGGVVAWAVNRDKNPRIARYILFFGILLSVILSIVTFVLGWGVVF